ncbi:MAG: ATP-binding protein [Candidatus Sedimenticola sp. (ex Thyasira tokunagai)]
MPKGLKSEEFGTRSVCRNPLIASLLLRCNYIEKLGTGIGRIRSALKSKTSQRLTKYGQNSPSLTSLPLLIDLMILG